MTALRWRSAEEEIRVQRARAKLKASRKDSADKWIHLTRIYNPVTGVEQDLWYNVETEEIAGRMTDRFLNEHLAQNNEEFTDNMNRRTKEPYRKIASIPPAMFYENFQHAMREGDADYVRKKLNDADLAKLRTHR